MPGTLILKRSEIARSVLTRPREDLKDVQNYAQAWSTSGVPSSDEVEEICEKEIKYFQNIATEDSSELRVQDRKGEDRMSWRELIMDAINELRYTNPNVFFKATHSSCSTPPNKGHGISS